MKEREIKVGQLWSTEAGSMMLILDMWHHGGSGVKPGLAIIYMRRMTAPSPVSYQTTLALRTLECWQRGHQISLLEEP